MDDPPHPALPGHHRAGIPLCECKAELKRALTTAKVQRLVSAVNKSLAEVRPPRDDPPRALPHPPRTRRPGKRSSLRAKSAPMKVRAYDGPLPAPRADVHPPVPGVEGRARAFLAAPPVSVTLCANALRKPEDVEESLIHELVHAYDVRGRGGSDRASAALVPTARRAPDALVLRRQGRPVRLQPARVQVSRAGVRGLPLRAPHLFLRCAARCGQQGSRNASTGSSPSAGCGTIASRRRRLGRRRQVTVGSGAGRVDCRSPPAPPPSPPRLSDAVPESGQEMCA